jgi:hypothetical protein
MLNIALAMILIGISALILDTRNIAPRYTHCTRISVREFPASPLIRMLALVSLLGLAALVSMVFRK